MINDTVETEVDSVIAPPELNLDIFKKEGLPQFLQDMVNTACNHTEASPIAVTFNTIAFLSALVGREKIKCTWGEHDVDARPSFLIVGNTGVGKGISETLVKKVFYQFEAKHSQEKLRIIRAGLNSGEGLTNSMRDVSQDNETENHDKRLLSIDPEFYKVMAACSREGSTLSSTIRSLHDGDDLDSNTKNDQYTCSRPHLIMVGHITPAELIGKIRQVDLANGLLSRFMICHITLDKLVPIPKAATEPMIDSLVDGLKKIMNFVNTNPAMKFTSCFKSKYKESYDTFRLPQGIEVRRLLLTRTPKYVTMLSMIFAIMECKQEINSKHLDAALHIIRYWWKSVDYIFSTTEQQEKYQRAKINGDKIYHAIQELTKNQERCKQSEITKFLSNKIRKDDLNSGLKILLTSTPPKIKQTTGDRIKGGKAAKCYQLT